MQDQQKAKATTLNNSREQPKLMKIVSKKQRTKHKPEKNTKKEANKDNQKQPKHPKSIRQKINSTRQQHKTK